MKNSDYRKAFFYKYVTTHVKYAEKISLKSFKLVEKRFEKNILPFLPKDKSIPILDIGCGEGHFLHFLQNNGYYNARGIDLGNEQLIVARKMGIKNVEKADFFQYIEKYQNHFGVIVAFNVIEHFKKMEAVKALHLIYQALKLNGKLLIITPNAQSLSGLYSTFGDFTHEIIFNARSLAQILRVCGFANVIVRGFELSGSDLRSKIRVLLWKIIRCMYKILFVIERGTGRSIWEVRPIFEASLFAVGYKSYERSS